MVHLEDCGPARIWRYREATQRRLGQTSASVLDRPCSSEERLVTIDGPGNPHKSEVHRPNGVEQASDEEGWPIQSPGIMGLVRSAHPRADHYSRNVRPRSDRPSNARTVTGAPRLERQTSRHSAQLSTALSFVLCDLRGSRMFGKTKRAFTAHYVCQPSLNLGSDAKGQLPDTLLRFGVLRLSPRPRRNRA
jgi:hypothetical protein